MSIKIAHESPVELFYYIQSKTDYDYCLVHLLEENETYKELFVQACKEREVILDNSIFELGEAFDMKKFFDWVDIAFVQLLAGMHADFFAKLLVVPGAES